MLYYNTLLICISIISGIRDILTKKPYFTVDMVGYNTKIIG